MIPELIEQWNAHKEKLRERIKNTENSTIDYDYLVKCIVEVIMSEMEYDFDEIAVLHSGDYSGTAVYFIKPINDCLHFIDKIIYMNVEYGTCSLCDTLEYIQNLDFNSEYPNDQQLDDYMTLCLHLIQSAKYLGGNNETDI